MKPDSEPYTLKWTWLVRLTEVNTPALHHLGLLLAAFSNEHNICSPSQTQLSRLTGKSLRTVQHYLDAWEGAGFFVRYVGKGRKVSDDYNTNKYQLVIPTVRGEVTVPVKDGRRTYTFHFDIDPTGKFDQRSKHAAAKTLVNTQHAAYIERQFERQAQTTDGMEIEVKQDGTPTRGVPQEPYGDIAPSGASPEVSAPSGGTKPTLSDHVSNDFQEKSEAFVTSDTSTVKSAIPTVYATGETKHLEELARLAKEGTYPIRDVVNAALDSAAEFERLVREYSIPYFRKGARP